MTPTAGADYTRRSPRLPLEEDPIRALATALAIAVALVMGGCGGCQGSGGDVRRVVPTGADAAVVLPTLEGVRAPLTAFLAGVEGASGLLELVEARYGVALDADDGLEEAGLDGDAGLAVFVHEGALCVAAGVSDGARFEQLMASRVVLAAATLGPETSSPRTASVPADPTSGAAGWQLAWGVTAFDVGLVVVTPGEGAASALWRDLAVGQGGFLETPAGKRAAELGAAAGVWGGGALRLPAPEGLPAPLSGVAAGYAQGFERWALSADVSPDRLTLRADIGYAGEAGLPVTWVQPPGDAGAFHHVFPKTTTLYVRARANLASLRAVPKFLRANMLPKLPDVDRLPLPDASALVDLVDGELAVAFLGMDPDATVNHLMAPRHLREELLQMAHLALALRVRDAASAQAALDEMAAKATEQKWVVAPVAGGGWGGFTFVTQRRLRRWRAPRHDPKARPPTVRPRRYTALLKGDTFLLVTGRGEVQRFFDVAEGKAAALATVVEDGPAGLVGAALGDPNVSLGAVLTLTRITRELAEKGVPPYFLKMINDVRSLAVTVRVRSDGLGLDLEVSL